jgi:diaminopimelate epimerase
LGALANQSFVKMNGIGNEIVVVDMRASAAKWRTVRSVDGALPAAHAGHRRFRSHLQQ